MYLLVHTYIMLLQNKKKKEIIKGWFLKNYLFILYKIKTFRNNCVVLFTSRLVQSKLLLITGLVFMYTYITISTKTTASKGNTMVFSCFWVSMYSFFSFCFSFDVTFGLPPFNCLGMLSGIEKVYKSIKCELNINQSGAVSSLAHPINLIKNTVFQKFTI